MDSGLEDGGVKVGTKQWAGGCLDTGSGDTVGSEGGAGAGELEFWAMVLLRKRQMRGWETWGSYFLFPA